MDRERSLSMQFYKWVRSSEKFGDVKDNFYDRLERPKYDVKIAIGDVNAQVRKKELFPVIERPTSVNQLSRPNDQTSINRCIIPLSCRL